MLDKSGTAYSQVQPEVVSRFLPKTELSSSWSTCCIWTIPNPLGWHVLGLGYRNPSLVQLPMKSNRHGDDTSNSNQRRS